MTTRSTTLSEAASKRLLAGYGLPLADERDVASVDEAAAAAVAIGYPVVVKLCGDAIAHKTERGLVRLRLGDEARGARRRRRSCWPPPHRPTATCRCSSHRWSPATVS